MTRPTHDQWAKLVAAAFAVGLAWAAMSAAVHGKVDRADYDRDQGEVRRRLDTADSLKADVRAIRCHLQPQTIGCPR
jgi:hypothetical protein